MGEPHLPTEPWVFVVGADGRVRERFEGTVPVRELERSSAGKNLGRFPALSGRAKGSGWGRKHRGALR